MQGDLQDLVERHRLGYNYPQGSVPGLLTAIQTAMSDGVGESAESVSRFFFRVPRAVRRARVGTVAPCRPHPEACDVPQMSQT